ncbi:MAG: hypothetical protein R3C11_16185 [Planctomycetaceae bacterium]
MFRILLILSAITGFMLHLKEATPIITQKEQIDLATRFTAPSVPVDLQVEAWSKLPLAFYVFVGVTACINLRREGLIYIAIIVMLGTAVAFSFDSQNQIPKNFFLVSILWGGIWYSSAPVEESNQQTDEEEPADLLFEE